MSNVLSEHAVQLLAGLVKEERGGLLNGTISYGDAARNADEVELLDLCSQALRDVVAITDEVAQKLVELAREERSDIHGGYTCYGTSADDEDAAEELAAAIQALSTVGSVIA